MRTPQQRPAPQMSTGVEGWPTASSSPLPSQGGQGRPPRGDHRQSLKQKASCGPPVRGLEEEVRRRGAGVQASGRRVHWAFTLRREVIEGLSRGDRA